MDKSNRELVLEWWLKFRAQRNWHTQPDFDPMLVDSITELMDSIQQGTDESQYYRSTGKPYDIELTRDGAKVTARVWDMPEEVRNLEHSTEKTLAKDWAYQIISHNSPAIFVEGKALYIRGASREYDDFVHDKDFPTVESATEYFQHITALIDKLNAEYDVPVLKSEWQQAQDEITSLKRACEAYKRACDGYAARIQDDEKHCHHRIFELKEEINAVKSKYLLLVAKHTPTFDAEKVRELIDDVIEEAKYYGRFCEYSERYKLRVRRPV